MEFRNLIKLQIKILITRKEFQYSFTLMLFFVATAFIINCFSLYGKEITSVQAANQLWFGFSQYSSAVSSIVFIFVLPLISSMAFADTYYTEMNTGIYKNILTRCKKSNYIISKGIITFVSGFLVVFIPLLLSQFLSLIIAPVNSCIDVTNLPSFIFMHTENMVFQELFLNHPYLYNFLYIVISGIFGAVLALLSFALSFLPIRSRLLIIATPTVLYIVQAFISTLLFGAMYALCYYLFPFVGIRGLEPMYFFSVVSGTLVFSVIIITVKSIFIKDEVL